MPQNENLSADWQKELGSNWKETWGKYLHTIGNLTLTGYNSEYSDKSFKEKQEMEGGFKKSPLNLNEFIRSIDRWDAENIQRRADMLAGKALTIWDRPHLEDMVLESYKKRTETSMYTLENNHPKLLEGKTADLYQNLRKSILAIDNSVTEEIFKVYIAYKADTNFVDINPMSGGLKLILNMRFNEIRDPDGKCKDVSEVGRWGNGDVEVAFNNIEELPYIMFLIRQSFDKQMGND